MYKVCREGVYLRAAVDSEYRECLEESCTILHTALMA